MEPRLSMKIAIHKFNKWWSSVRKYRSLAQCLRGGHKWRQTVFSAPERKVVLCLTCGRRRLDQ